jgi:hypothetical protein
MSVLYIRHYKALEPYAQRHNANALAPMAKRSGHPAWFERLTMTPFFVVPPFWISQIFTTEMTDWTGSASLRKLISYLRAWILHYFKKNICSNTTCSSLTGIALPYRFNPAISILCNHKSVFLINKRLPNGK